MAHRLAVNLYCKRPMLYRFRLALYRNVSFLYRGILLRLWPRNSVLLKCEAWEDWLMTVLRSDLALYTALIYNPYRLCIVGPTYSYIFYIWDVYHWSVSKISNWHFIFRGLVVRCKINIVLSQSNPTYRTSSDRTQSDRFRLWILASQTRASRVWCSTRMNVQQARLTNYIAMCALCIVKSGALLYSEVNLHYRVWPPNYIVDSSDPALSEFRADSGLLTI